MMDLQLFLQIIYEMISIKDAKRTNKNMYGGLTLLGPLYEKGDHEAEGSKLGCHGPLAELALPESEEADVPHVNGCNYDNLLPHFQSCKRIGLSSDVCWIRGGIDSSLCKHPWEKSSEVIGKSRRERGLFCVGCLHIWTRAVLFSVAFER